MKKREVPKERLTQVIENFSHHKVLVVGDIMLDHFIWGKVSRISPEAPVPVVEIVKETFLLGGAGNVANNIHRLGGAPILGGVVGEDGEAKKIVDLLEETKAPATSIIKDPARPTTMKTRIIAHHQQVVRADREKLENISPQIEEKLISFVESVIDEVEAIVISDYNKGVITSRLMESLLPAAAKRKLPVVVDPKWQNFPLYKPISLITPNLVEAERITGITISDEDKLIQAGTWILNSVGCEGVLITRGKKGMTLFQPGGEADWRHIPTVAKEVYDVTGAGDTVVSSLTLALLAGASIPEAALIANYAAGLVVGKVGTATLTISELQQAILSF